jgi:PAS domain-containing protein
MIAAREPGRQADCARRTSPQGDRLPTIYTYRMALGPLAGRRPDRRGRRPVEVDLSQEAFGAELRTFRSGLQEFHRRVTAEGGTTPADLALREQLLAELESALEELRASEEELDARAIQLDGIQQTMDDERRRWQRWFDTAPVPYLLTDGFGTIVAANRRVSEMLGIPPKFLSGKPLPSLVAFSDRERVRRMLNALSHGGSATGDGAPNQLNLRLMPRHWDRAPLAVTASVGVAREEDGKPLSVAWVLQPTMPLAPSAPVPEIPRPRPGGKAGWEHGALNRLLAATIESTPALLRVDAAGLLMVDGGGVLRPVAATDRGVATMETLQVDLDEGPAVEAARQVAPVWTDDLEADVRWQRLGWVAASYRSRGCWPCRCWPTRTTLATPPRPAWSSWSGSAGTAGATRRSRRPWPTARPSADCCASGWPPGGPRSAPSGCAGRRTTAWWSSRPRAC